MKKPEVLAPAGDFLKMKYAIAYGADAVYMAGPSFGMRAAAANFNYDELKEAISYAHARGVKCYITVNVMPSNEDLPLLPDYLAHLQDCGADALIVADVGVIRLEKKYAQTHKKRIDNIVRCGCLCNRSLYFNQRTLEWRIQLYTAERDRNL